MRCCAATLIGPTLLLLLLTGCSFDTSGLPPGVMPRDRSIILVDSGGDLAPIDLGRPDRAPTDGPICAWTYRRKLTFGTPLLTKDLKDVPVLVAIDGQRLDYGKAKADGSDLRFTDADGVTVLPHEIERWDPKGRSFIWVKVPQIDSGSTTDHIWLYHGNASPTPGPAGSGVWSNGYLGVWHLNNDPTAAPPQIKDSSGAGIDLTVQGMIPKAARVACKVGPGLELDGASQSLVGKLAAAPTVFTLEAWIRLDMVKYSERHIVELYGVQFFVETNGKLETGDTYDEFGTNGLTVLQAQQWYHVALVQGGAGWAIYLDGKLETSGTEITTPGRNLFVGRIHYSPASSTYLDGQMDEVRVSGVDRSAAWIGVQRRSMNDALLSYGAEQLTGAACPP